LLPLFIETNGYRMVQRPPFDKNELDQVFAAMRRETAGLRRWLRPVLIGLLVLGLAATSYYQVQPEEVAVVQRFGKYIRTAEPGPHFKLPFGIETATKVPVERQLKLEFGFRTTQQAGSRSEFHKDKETEAEASILTGDLNVASVEWVVQYKIADPRKYLFEVRDVETTFRAMTEAAMRSVVGDHSVSELLTSGRETIATQAKEVLSDMCRRYDTGIIVQQLVLQDVDPPESVKPSFNEVNQAIQERERAVNEAWAEYNQEIPRARGQAEQQVRRAEGAAVERSNRADGDAQRFLALLAEYKKAPEVTRSRLYLETMAEVVPKTGRRVVVDDKVRGMLPLLNLDRAGGAQ
jgi:modulator of FtsH protease HflK